MKLRIIKYSFFILLFYSCGAHKNSHKSSKDDNNVTNKPIANNSNLKGVKKFTKELYKKNPSLSKLKLAYIETYASIAVEEMHSSNIPASITLAQGILESGSGRSELASKSNNHFGIKCHSGWSGKKVYHDDDKAGECFRKYEYVATSYKDHSEFLTKRKRYSFLFNYDKRDYKSWAKGLKKAGYATDKKYPNKLITIIENYNLYEFDTLKRDAEFDFKESSKDSVKEVTSKLESYTVVKGDTLYSIARKFNTTVNILKDLNDLIDTNLAIGQQLQIK
ncbi:glucosaminidase domain-containing protein [uncultured Polaribacter sp.]|uniref:glucosaminidase domain-containing protein n=1 Tax=uncultured Polaribacter sp. TaxID=174711 RepID=UPI0026339231|nr:glucosaminidase domain-containing protein [uncultured Polaribacter sp.]